MKKILSIIFFLTVLSMLAKGAALPITVTGSNGADGNYASLTNPGDAFAKINASSQTGYTIYITINGSSTAESGSVTLNAGTWTSLIIYPTVTGCTISTSLNKPLIYYNGADNVTVDGRVNTLGSTADLKIINTSIGSSASAFRLANSSENNIIRYCNIQGSDTSINRGIIRISTSVSGNGNDQNIIEYNNITGSTSGRPGSAIYSQGSAGFENSGNIIRNNNIYDVLNPGRTSYAIYLATFTTSCTISGNSIYETTSFSSTALVTYYALRIDNTSGTNFTINDNFIGGSNVQCGGSAWTKTDSDNDFTGIYMNVGTGLASNVQNNTINNMIWNNSGTGTWTGISAAGGDVNIGTTSGNSIGASNGSGSVSVTVGATAANLYGINIASTGIVDCQNNKIGSITLSNTSPSNSSNLSGIYSTAAGGSSTLNNISRNFIYDLSVANSSSASRVYGIRIVSGWTTYSNNVVRLGGNAVLTIYGIYEAPTAGSNNNVYFNTVYINGQPSSGASSSFALYDGATSTTRVIENNILVNARSNTGGSATGKHYAIRLQSASNLIIDYNDYYFDTIPTSGGVLGYLTSDRTSLSAWQTATGQDGSSMNINPYGPSFTAGNSANDYIPSACVIVGVAIPGITTDYSGTTRQVPPSIGAFEIALCPTVTVYKTGVLQANYLHLKQAFDAFNNGTHNTGTFEIRINGDMTENSSAVLNASGTGSANYDSIYIFPTLAAGITITGNLAAPIIDLNGAHNVIIDGRVNRAGNNKHMAIINSSNSATAGTSTIRMINGASNNIIKYCTLKGSSTAAVSGIVLFSTSTGATGNNSNVIDNNDITSSAPANKPLYGIYSLGTATLDNTGNRIRNNNFYDILNRGKATNEIFLDLNNSAWTISGNSFYETTSLLPTLNSLNYYIIRINNSGGNYSVSGNYIGGNAPLCGGTPLIKTNSFNSIFFGIHLTAGTGITDTIRNNTIKNFSWSNSTNGNWTGIHIASGDGIISGNVIGETTTTGSILVTSLTNGNNFYGINIATTGNVSCLSNSVGSITLANAAANASNFFGINKTSSAGTTTINGNTIGSKTVVNSILASSASTGNTQSVTGIYNAGTGAVRIDSNIVANLTNSTTNVAGSVIGLNFTGNSGAGIVSKNFIRSLSGSSSSGLIYGIKTNTGSCTYSNNIITLGGNTPATIYGIYETGAAGNNNKLFFNTVYIGGSVAAGANKTYALFSAVNANTRDFRNNIFVNARSTAGGANLHYAMYIAATGGTITCDYNDYKVSGTGGTLGYYGANKTVLPIVTGQDAASQAQDPAFAAIGTNPEDYLPGQFFQGVAGTGITTDFGGNPRTVPTMGCWEGYINKWKGSLSTDWNTGGNWAAGRVPLSDGDIIFDPAPVNNLVMDQDRSVKNITDSTTFTVVINGHKLTLKGKFYFSSGSKIDASATGSTLEFASDSAQIISDSQIISNSVVNSVPNMIVNNGKGVSLNTDFTIENTLTINTGKTISVSAVKLLNVPGTIINNAGNTGLVLKSDATGDAKLITGSTSAGSVELYLTGGLVSADVGIYHYITPPVQTVHIGSTIAEVNTNLGLTWFSGDLLLYSEPAAVANKDAGWKYFDGYPAVGSPVFTDMTPARGYNIYLTQNDKMTFKGQINAASNNFTLDYTASNTDPGWNLVGNPFPCNYDLNGVAGLGTIVPGISNTVYYNNNGGYTYWNVYTNTGSTAGYSDILPPMTGFYVHVSQSGMTLNLPASSKTQAPADSRTMHKKSSNTLIKASDVKKIKLVLSNGSKTDETVLMLFDDATSTYNEHYDAFKLTDKKYNGPSIFSQLNGKNYFMKAVSANDTQRVVVPLRVIIKESGKQQIDITEFENLDGIKVTLKHGDNKTLLKSGASYSFSADAGTYDNFELIFGDSNIKRQDKASQDFGVWYKNDYLNVTFSGDVSSAGQSIIIYAMNGTMVYNDRTISLVPDQINQIPVRLQSGFYIADIVTDGKHHRLKFVVY